MEASNKEKKTPVKWLIIIAGPTAVGKTDVAIQIAGKLQTEIISADSRQVYRQMNIGTAKPDAQQLKEVPHHLIDFIDIESTYSVGQFERDTLNLLERLFTSNDVVVMTGGTGLYLRAIMEGIDDFPDVPDEVSSKWEEQYHSLGIKYLQKKIKELDPVYAENVDLNNPHRLIRALAVCESTGKPYSFFLRGEKVKRDFSTLQICLSRDRQELYDRINLRVDNMMSKGLLEEVKSLLPSQNLRALQTVGYRELFRHLNGEIDLDEAVDQIKKHSRRYAKRQMTWFRNQGEWEYFHPDQVQNIIEHIILQISLLNVEE